MMNNSAEIGKYDTHKKSCLTKIAHLAKKCPKVFCQGLSLVIFKSEFLNLLYDSDSWSLDFKIEFFPFQTDIFTIHLCQSVDG